jgi:hypothetical protein
VILKPKQTWKKLRRSLYQVTDRLRKSIDKGIVETVVALMAHGFRTSASCEGHVSRSCAYPWVHIDLPKERKKKEHIQKHLKQLLDEFYHGRNRGGDAVLIVVKLGRGSTWRLQCSGGRLLDQMPKEILTAKMRRKILKRYRKEMDTFRRFLKENFFTTKI